MRLNRARQFAEYSEAMRWYLLDAYERSTIAERQAGLEWYPRAVHGCKVWAQQFGIEPATVASVIAALSPQCEWTANLRCALTLLQGEPLNPGNGALNVNIRKGMRILQDRATLPDAYFDYAPKVCAFARNLQGDSESVTIDAHAAQAALEDVTHNFNGRAGVYEVFADVYRSAAHTLGLRPCDFQAIVWHVWKREHPPAKKRAARTQWTPIGTLED